MANHIFKVATERGETNAYDISLYLTTSTGNPYTVVEGDTITFKWEVHIGGSVPSQLNFSNFSGFTDNSWGTLYSVGSSFTRTVLSGGSLPEALAPRVSTTGSGFKSWYLSRVSAIDTLPDAFSLGPNVTNANPSQHYYSNKVTITGINTSVTASANNGGLVSKNNGPFVSSVTVVNGDKIQLRATSASAYGAVSNTTLTVGTGTALFRVTNMASPAAGQIIPLGITSGQISLSQIGDLFGRPYLTNQTVLSDYLKAPTKLRVPDIAENAGVPTALPINLSHFYGSATSFFISTYPSNKYLDYDTTSQGGTFYLKWEVGVDWFLGYHPDVMNVAEYRYEFTETGAQTGLGVSSQVPYGTWHVLNRVIQVGITVPAYVERHYSGTITMYARHPKAPTKVVSCQVQCWLEFYGP